MYALIFREYFTAKLFAQLQQNDVYNRISILALFNYAMRKAWLQQTRIGLSLYDASGKGYLRESVILILFYTSNALSIFIIIIK